MFHIIFTFERFGWQTKKISVPTALLLLSPSSEAQESPGLGLAGEMARETKGFISLSTSNTVGVNISLAFPQWSKLKGEKGLKMDLETGKH